MRLRAKEKGGFYPLPSRTRYALAQMLKPAVFEGLIRLLDPCAGEGQALDEILWALRYAKSPTTTTKAEILAYAVEPHAGRYWECQRLFTQARSLKAYWEETTVSEAAFSLLYLNPPYDWDAVEQEEQEDNETPGSRKNRLEYNFLRESLTKLQAGGVLVYVLPHRILGVERVARTLANNFRDITVFSLPEGEYEIFKQCVVFAYRRDGLVEDGVTAKELMRWGVDRPPVIYPLDEEAKTPVYLVPASTLPPTKLVFRQTTLSYEESAELVYTQGAAKSLEWQRMRNPPKTSFQPVIRLRTGHIGPLISSGQLGTVNLGDLLIRGKDNKRIIAQNEYGQVVEPNSRTCKTWTEQFATEIFCIDGLGKYRIINKPDDLRLLLDQYGPLLHEIVQDRYPPLYTGPTEAEWRKLNTLMKKKRLPGREEAGLLTAQKHVVAAICRVLKKKHAAIIVGEMGTGKGPMQLAAIDLLDAYPALVATPAHMVAKFAREAFDTIPGCKPIIVHTTADLDKARKAYKAGDKMVLVTSYESLKTGPRWENAAMRGSKTQDIIDPDSGAVVGRKRVRIYRCPRCGAEAPTGLKKSKQPLRCEKLHARLNKRTGKLEAKPCGEKLMQFGPLKKWPLARYIHEQMPGFVKMFVADEIHKTKAKGTDIAQAFQLMCKSVDYVLGGTGTLFGGKSTDLFFLLHRMNYEIRKRFGFNQENAWSEIYGRRQFILADDGDDFGRNNGRRRRVARTKELPGISPAVYAWVFEQVVFLKVSELGFQMPPYNEQIERLFMAEVQKLQYQWLYETLYRRIHSGASSFSSIGMKTAMALMGVFLQNCLSRVNSGFRTERLFWKPPGEAKHEPVLVPRDESKEYGYTDTDDALVIHNLSDTDADLEGGDPQDQRGLFDEPEAEAETPGKKPPRLEPMDLYPIVKPGELLPKEQWLISTIKAELEQNRTVLLYVRQTGKRNIQPRLADILNRHGIRAIILPDGNAASREAWIHEHTKFAHVLITNPKKVETGLDLIMFSTIVFYEPDYSLFTTWQAMRRVWRLGQTKAVKVIIPIYADAMEAQALEIMAAKFRAALLLYGEAGAGLAQEAETQDLMAELVQQVLDGQIHSANGIASLMADSIAAEMEGAQATEGMPSAEELAELFAELAESDAEEDFDAEGEEYIDVDYQVVDDGPTFTGMHNGQAEDLPIFAALAAMTELQEQPAEAAATDDDGLYSLFFAEAPAAETPAETPAETAAETPAAQPQAETAPAPAAEEAEPIVIMHAEEAFATALEMAVDALHEQMAALRPGDRITLPSGRKGQILSIEDGYAEVLYADTHFCVLAPLADLTPEAQPQAESQAESQAQPQPAAEAAAAAPAPAAKPAKDTRTPAIQDFWNFQTRKDPSSGITSITLQPKEGKKGKKSKKDDDAPVQQDFYSLFLTTEPTFTDPAKPS
ncbi:MAG: DUF6094 domain-containing protein [Caldilineaceae bacterium]